MDGVLLVQFDQITFRSANNGPGYMAEGGDFGSSGEKKIFGGTCQGIFDRLHPAFHANRGFFREWNSGLFRRIGGRCNMSHQIHHLRLNFLQWCLPVVVRRKFCPKQTQETICFVQVSQAVNTYVSFGYSTSATEPGGAAVACTCRYVTFQDIRSVSGFTERARVSEDLGGLCDRCPIALMILSKE